MCAANIRSVWGYKIGSILYVWNMISIDRDADGDKNMFEEKYIFSVTQNFLSNLRIEKMFFQSNCMLNVGVPYLFILSCHHCHCHVRDMCKTNVTTYTIYILYIDNQYQNFFSILGHKICLIFCHDSRLLIFHVYDVIQKISRHVNSAIYVRTLKT